MKHKLLKLNKNTVYVIEIPETGADGDISFHNENKLIN